ncbi:MAG: hypothetical protein RLZZ387_3699 [Chloroflexota bacterium]|jgi:O-antigen/teichoic acid export membrane protein
MLTPSAQLFLAAVAALLPLLGVAAWLWRRYYREDSADTARVIARNSALPIAAGLLNKLIDFGFAVITLRALGPEGSGAYAFVALIVGLYFVTVSNWGLNDLTVREVAADPARAPRLFSITLLLRWGISALLLPVCAALVIGYELLGNPLSPAAVLALALLGLHLFPAALAAACSASFQAMQRMEVTALVLVVTNIAKVLVGAAALVLLPDIPGRVVALAAVALTITALNAAVFLELQQRMLFRATFAWDWVQGRAMLREAFPLLLNSLLIAVFFRFDIVIMRAASNDVSVGIYDAAYKLINVTQIVPPYFVAALFPVLARYAVADRAALERASTRAVGLLQLLAWPATVGITLLAPELILLVGGRAYLPDAALALAVLIWYLPLAYASGVAQYVLIAVRRQGTITRAFAAAATFNLALNLLLIPRYGYLAAAAVTVATEVALIVPFLAALRAEGVALKLPRLVWRPATAALMMGAVMLATRALVPGGAWLAALAAAPAYLAALWALGGIGAEERALARRVLGRGVRTGA